MPPRKINLVEAADAKIAKVFDWHAHEHEDEAFLVLRGRIVIDFRDGAVELGEGDFMVVPRGVEHRPRSLTPEPVVLMFEPATTLNTGNAKSDHTVTDLKRL